MSNVEERNVCEEEIEHRLALDHARTVLQVLGSTQIVLSNPEGQKIVAAYRWIGGIAKSIEERLIELKAHESKQA